MIRWTSRLFRPARSAAYDVAMNDRSGNRPRAKAGNRRETISLFPWRGGASRMRRGLFYATWSCRNWSRLSHTSR